MNANLSFLIDELSQNIRRTNQVKEELLGKLLSQVRPAAESFSLDKGE